MGCQQSLVYLPGDPNQPIIEGLLLWLDVSRGIQRSGPYVTKWNSCIVDRQLISCTAVDGFPLFKDSDTSFPAHVEFDYNRSMKIVPPLLDIQTIISVHCWKAPTNPERAPVYLLCGTEQGPFQGTGESICCQPENGSHQGEAFYRSSIRLNGISHHTRDVTVWKDQMKIASVICDSRVPSNGDIRTVNRIGRDQTSHEFAGYLTELLVFHRKLSENEIVVIENYLRGKYVMYFNEASSYQSSHYPLVGQPVPQLHQHPQQPFHGQGYPSPPSHQYPQLQQLPQQYPPFPPQQNLYRQHPPIVQGYPHQGYQPQPLPQPHTPHHQQPYAQQFPRPQAQYQHQSNPPVYQQQYHAQPPLLQQQYQPYPQPSPTLQQGQQLQPPPGVSYGQLIPIGQHLSPGVTPAVTYRS
jgi:hypothetical protein